MFAPPPPHTICVALVTRGLAEGGVITILGLVPADMFRKRYSPDNVVTALYAITLILYSTCTVMSTSRHKDVGAPVDSRRELFKPLALAVTALFCVSPLVQCALSNDLPFRRRTRDLFVSLAILGILTNYGMFVCNVRWVEVDSGSGYVRASPYVENVVLLYDAIVEIAAMYLPFFTIPFALNLIKDNEGRGGAGEERDVSDGGVLEKVEPLLPSPTRSTFDF